MPTLSDADLTEVTAVRVREARYRVLNAQLDATLKAGGTIDGTEFQELKQLGDMLAEDVRFLLSMIARLQE